MGLGLVGQKGKGLLPMAALTYCLLAATSDCRVAKLGYLAIVLRYQQLLLVCSLGSARGCPGSTCISPVWLERCNTGQVKLHYIFSRV